MLSFNACKNLTCTNPLTAAKKIICGIEILLSKFKCNEKHCCTNTAVCYVPSQYKYY